MDTDSFIVCIKKMFTQTIILQIIKLEDHDLEGKNVIGLMKDKLDRKTKAKFVGLKPKMYSYLADDSCYDKRQKLQKLV